MVYNSSMPGPEQNPNGITRREMTRGASALAAISAAGMSSLNAQPTEGIVWNEKGLITNFHGIQRRDVLKNLAPYHLTVRNKEGKDVDPYLGLVDEKGNSCCSGQDCRVAIVRRINPEGPIPKFAVAINLNGQPIFGIANPSTGTAINPKRVLPPEMSPKDFPPLPRADEPHACIIGGGPPVSDGYATPDPDQRETLGEVRCLILPSGT